MFFYDKTVYYSIRLNKEQPLNISSDLIGKCIESVNRNIIGAGNITDIKYGNWDIEMQKRTKIFLDEFLQAFESNSNLS
ncbi:MAG: hypothetical protein K0R22_93 [Sporomusa sp.]|jgi:hypothetical protein|nr:hypothetical protein [Sporomusa sp.]